MQFGQLLIKDNKLYITYDKYLAFTYTFLGMEYLNINNIIDYIVYDLNLSRSKRITWKKIVKDLISSKVSLSISERLNFPKYILRMLDKINISLVPKDARYSNNDIVGLLKEEALVETENN